MVGLTEREKLARENKDRTSFSLYGALLPEKSLDGDGANDYNPSYITASDTLNVSNRNHTFQESAGLPGSSVSKFIGLSLLSGANQLYNILPSIGNLVTPKNSEGEDIFSQVDTYDLVAGLDSNLAEFYKEHQEGIDLVGFVASSIVPGTAGMKVLSAGQKSLRGAMAAGTYGKNTGRAMGLLVPKSRLHVKAALKEVRDQTGVSKLLTGESLKAIGAGAHQAVLEATFFELGVAATMFNSPVLENQDFGDFVHNIAWSAGIFGIVGGVVNGAKLKGALNRTQTRVEEQLRPHKFIKEVTEAAPTNQRIALYFEQLEDLKRNQPSASLKGARKEYTEEAARTQRTVIEQQIKADIKTLAGDDQVMTDTLYETFKSASARDAQNAMVGVVEASGLGATAKVADRAAKLELKVIAGKASQKEIDEYAASSIRNGYSKLWGEGAETVFSEAPVALRMADRVKKGQQVNINGNVVRAGAAKWKFDLSYNLGTPKKGLAALKALGKGKGPKAYNPYLGKTAVDLDARYYWASKLAPFKSPTAANPLRLHVDDIPLMEKAMQDLGEELATNPHIEFAGLAKGQSSPRTVGIHEFLGDQKVAGAVRMLDSKSKGYVQRSQEEIAAIWNVKNDFLSGDVVRAAGTKYDASDIFANQHHATTYTAKLVSQGSRDATAPLVNMHEVPQHVRLTYNTKLDPSIQTNTSPAGPVVPTTHLAGVGADAGINNFVVENMVIIKEQQRLYQESAERAFAHVLGGVPASRYVDITSEMVFSGARSTGAGAGYFGAANGNYGALASFVESVGKLTNINIRTAQEKVTDIMNPVLQKVATNKNAAIEFESLNNKIRSIEGNYGLNDAGDAFEPLVLLRYNKAVAEAGGDLDAIARIPEPVLPNPTMPASIPIANQEVRNLVKTHMEVNASNISKEATLRTAGGVQVNISPDAYYPIPVNPRDYEHFAMVTDRTITATNQKSMIYARSAAELETMVKKVRQHNSQLRVEFKSEMESRIKDAGFFDEAKTVSDNYLDSAVRRAGASSSYLPVTDPQKIVNNMMDWHMRRQSGIVREAVATKYEVQISELQRLGKEATSVATSKFDKSSLEKFAEESVENPFNDYIKTMMDIKKTSDFPIHVKLNQLVDQKFSEMYDTLGKAVTASKSAEELADTNRILQQYGYKGAYYDAEMELLVNATPNRGKLESAVRAGNSMMATVVLRWDAMNAMVNAVSANVLLGAETKAIMRAIGKGNEETAGKLAALTDIAVPGTGKQMFSANKLIGNSMTRVMKMEKGSPEYQFYKDTGILTSISEQHRGIIDDLTFDPAKGFTAYESKLNKVRKQLVAAGDKGEVITGNRYAEEFNRLVAADVMKQMSDVAIDAGLMTAKEQLAYINTFVNRTQGNYLASQRPMMFQGAMGQAVGLFQTYQFNLMQQLLRHSAEGGAKDAATLLALQGTIHGMNGLPAFNAANEFLVGNASGNTEHKDAYTALYGIAGKEAGDWLMYGFGSNALGLLHPDLKVNMYTRGDINPRHVTIVPTNPASVPIVQASGKVLGNLFSTAGNIAAGGDFTTSILQGLEHNGISRPLAGLAQTLQGLNNPHQASYNTSKQGNVIAANDLFSLANLGRIAGAKPLDTAIAIDATYRYKAYSLEDSARKQVLGHAIKTKLIAGGSVSREEMNEFAQKYAEIGGTQQEFGQWATQLYKTANRSQANEIQRNLNDPFNQSMQELMGGELLEDFK